MPKQTIAALLSIWTVIVAVAPAPIRAEDAKVDRLDAKVIATITVREGDFRKVVLSADGKTVATICGMSDTTVELWDTSTGKAKGALKNGNQTVYAVAFTPDNKTIITGDGHGMVGVWDGTTFKLRKKFKATLDVAKDFGSMIKSITIAPDAKTVYVAEDDHAPGIWDVAKGKRLVKDRAIGKGDVDLVAVAPKSQVLASVAYDFRLFDAKTGKERKVVPLEYGGARSLGFSPDEKSVAVGQSSGLLLVDVASGKITVLEDTGFSAAVAFTSDGNSLVTFSDPSLCVWDLASGKKVAAFELEQAFRDSSVGALSGDGAMAAVPLSKTELQIFEIAPPKPKK